MLHGFRFQLSLRERAETKLSPGSCFPIVGFLVTPDSDGLFWGHQVSESGTAYRSTDAAMAVPVPLSLKSVCSGCTKFNRYAFASRTQQITFQKMHQITEFLSFFVSV